MHWSCELFCCIDCPLHLVLVWTLILKSIGRRFEKLPGESCHSDLIMFWPKLHCACIHMWQTCSAFHGMTWLGSCLFDQCRSCHQFVVQWWLQKSSTSAFSLFYLWWVEIFFNIFLAVLCVQVDFRLFLVWSMYSFAVAFDGVDIFVLELKWWQWSGLIGHCQLHCRGCQPSGWTCIDAKIV